MSSPRSRFEPYRQALQAISTRTGTPLPSLVFSFAILHELTAIVPLAGFFFSARALGVGESVVEAIRTGSSSAALGTSGRPLQEKARQWIDEGEQWAERVGSRYGIFGFEKRDRQQARHEEETESSNLLAVSEGTGRFQSSHLAGDAANAIVAYGLTKALLPIRVGASIYFAPAFSRRILDPLRRNVLRLFRRG